MVFLCSLYVLAVVFFQY